MARFTTRVSASILGLAGVLALNDQTQGAGFQITEQSVTGLGRAFAGSGVAGDDASAIFYNPAGMTLLQGRRVQVGAIFISSSGEFANRGSTQTFLTPQGALTLPSSGPEDDAGTGSLVPNLYYQMDLTDRVRLGLGVVAPFGLKTLYEGNWVGRFHALKSELKTVDVNPSVAYRVNEQLSVGVGFSAQYADAELSRAVFTGPGNPAGFARIKADDWGFGYNLGAMYEFDADTRIGLSYRSKVTQDATGTRQLTGVGARSGTVGAEASVDLPETVYLSAFRRLSPRLALMGTARWTNWSRFDELRVKFGDGSPDDVTREDWEDTWFLAVGLSYAYSPQWTFNTGYAYDQSPVRSAELRTPRIPDSDRNWLGIGASYRPSPSLSLDVAYAHLFFKDSTLRNTIDLVPTARGAFTDTLVGEYQSDADLVGVQVNYSF